MGGGIHDNDDEPWHIKAKHVFLKCEQTPATNLQQQFGAFINYHGEQRK